MKYDSSWSVKISESDKIKMVNSLQKKTSSSFHSDIVKRCISEKFKKCQLIVIARTLRLHVKKGNMIRIEIACSTHCKNKYVVTLKKCSLYLVISVLSGQNSSDKVVSFPTKKSNDQDQTYSSGDDFVETPFKNLPKKKSFKRKSVNTDKETARNFGKSYDNPLDLSVKVNPAGTSKNNKSYSSDSKILDETCEKGHNSYQANQSSVPQTPSPNNFSFFAPDTLQNSCNPVTFDDVLSCVGKTNAVSVSVSQGSSIGIIRGKIPSIWGHIKLPFPILQFFVLLICRKTVLTHV